MNFLRQLHFCFYLHNASERKKAAVSRTFDDSRHPFWVYGGRKKTASCRPHAVISVSQRWARNRNSRPQKQQHEKNTKPTTENIGYNLFRIITKSFTRRIWIKISQMNAELNIHLFTHVFCTYTKMHNSFQVQ